jgi:hypothetical protein
MVRADVGSTAAVVEEIGVLIFCLFGCIGALMAIGNPRLRQRMRAPQSGEPASQVVLVVAVWLFFAVVALGCLAILVLSIAGFIPWSKEFQ